MLINVDVIYFASLVKYFGDTEDKSTEKESIKVNIIFKKNDISVTRIWNMCVHKYQANIFYYDSYSRLYSVLRYAFKHFKSCLVAGISR